MERFNPFANSSLNDDPDPFSTSFNRSNINPPQAASLGNKQLPSQRQPIGRNDSTSNRYAGLSSQPQRTTPTFSQSPAKYSTSFPDPFGDLVDEEEARTRIQAEELKEKETKTPPRLPPAPPSRGQQQTSSVGNRSNSVTFAPTTSHSVDVPGSVASPTRVSGGRDQSSRGFTSFLSRATSVTSSSVTDRVSGAVGSVRSAVDSISNQIQQAVPSNLNERISSTATNLITSSNSVTDQLQQQQQSAASYFASKLSSATGQFTSSGQSLNSLAVSRQRVILILDSISNTDWAQQFSNYNKLMSGASANQSTTQSALTSFFSSATAQLSSSFPTQTQNEGADLIEQADFRDISILANQASSTATIYLNSTSHQQPASSSASSSSFVNRSSSMVSGFGLTQRAGGSSQSNLNLNNSNSTSLSNTAKIIRPEYVIVRQRTKDKAQLDHLRGIVKALDYCLVPMFEPIEIWNVFQDRQTIFAKLLRVQKTLGKENFPLISQIYCQTYQDLLNYISTASITLPCSARTGPLGEGKITIDNLQMLKDFASIMATSGLSCTLEQYLNVKCDLIVQKLGTSLKIFKKSKVVAGSVDDNTNVTQDGNISSSPKLIDNQQQQQASRQSATRQSSLGSGVLSSLISGQQQQQQIARRSSSDVNGYERLGEVSVRYRNWVEAITREFDNKIEAFCIKIVVANNDREYIVGLRDCSMEFLGSIENQEEDRRSFVELLMSNMNTVLPKHTLSRESSLAGYAATTGSGIGNENVRRTSSEEKNSSRHYDSIDVASNSPLRDKTKFNSQSQIGINGPSSSSMYGKRVREGEDGFGAINNRKANIGTSAGNSAAFGQLSSRSQSVSMNQSDYMADQQSSGIGSKSVYFSRRGSERSDSFNTDLTNDDLSSASARGDSQTVLTSNSSGLHQRQASLGQSFFDQTSTAFSSLQKQSLSFFKRLDASRAGDISNTPPQSAKSDKGFDRNFVTPINQGDSFALAGTGSSVVGARNGFKSQSIDSSSLDRTGRGSLRKPRETPPKPPPPQTITYRQSSLASYSTSSSQSTRPGSSSTPNSTPSQTRQNSSAATASSSSNEQEHGNQRGRVVRQNSALSAFEPFDQELQQAPTKATDDELVGPGSSSTILGSEQGQVPQLEKAQKALETVKKGNFDSASITSADSNSTGETTTAEDTMNNLKKTFASIFGDKCD